MSTTLKGAAKAQRAAQRRGLFTRTTLWAAVLLSVVLWGAWPAHSQNRGDDPRKDAEDAPTGAVGEVFFKDLPPHVDSLGQTGFYWRLPAVTHGRTTRPPLDQMIVVLHHEEDKRGPKDVTAVIEGYSITPRVIVAAPSAKIHVEHNGEDVIRLEAPGRSGIEPLTLEKPGSTATISLDKPGRYLLQAMEYTSILTYVIVTESIAESRLRAKSNDRAQFNLGDVPAGQYELRIYYQGKIILEEKIEVNAEGALTKTGFLLNRDDWQRATQLP